MTLPVLVVQHADDCPPAWFGTWLTDAGRSLDVRRPYDGDDLPADLTGHAAYVVLGGPQSANDDTVPWMASTRALFRAAAHDGVPALGICLGHQICAVALGGTVARNPHGQQLGLVPTGWLPAAADDRLVGALTGIADGVHWNDDVVVDLPPDATLLASTDRGEPQVVRFAPTVWGVQMHPEVDESVLGPWAEDDRHRYDDDRLDDAVRAVAAARTRLENDWRGLAAAITALLHP